MSNNIGTIETIVEDAKLVNEYFHTGLWRSFITSAQWGIVSHLFYWLDKHREAAMYERPMDPERVRAGEEKLAGIVARYHWALKRTGDQRLVVNLQSIGETVDAFISSGTRPQDEENEEFNLEMRMAQSVEVLRARRDRDVVKIKEIKINADGEISQAAANLKLLEAHDKAELAVEKAEARVRKVAEAEIEASRQAKAETLKFLRDEVVSQLQGYTDMVLADSDVYGTESMYYQGEESHGIEVDVFGMRSLLNSIINTGERQLKGNNERAQNASLSFKRELYTNNSLIMSVIFAASEELVLVEREIENATTTTENTGERQEEEPEAYTMFA